MRILQIAPLVTPENAYGGPITVALGQCKALRDAGHEVILAAGTQGYDEVPAELDGIPVHLFPARALLPGSTLGGLASPQLLAWVRGVARRADVVHVHLARDLTTLPAAALLAQAGIPFCVQTHGMVVESDSPLAPPLDTLLTRRVMRRAARVFYLTEAERTSLERLFPEARLEFLRNGITLPEEGRRARTDDVLEVLYLARVQERKRPLDFVAMAVALAGEFPHARFRMVGPDEGEGDAVRAAINASRLGDRLRWDGPLPPAACAEAMRRADLYVLPSVNEPYPMSVLEALSHGLPVIITDTCGLADEVRRSGAGSVVTAGAEPVTQAVRRFLGSPELRAAASENALRVASQDLSLAAVVQQLDAAYRDAAQASPASFSPAALPPVTADTACVVVIASAGRPAALDRLLTALPEQTRLPRDVIVSVPDRASLPPSSDGHIEHRVVMAEKGLTKQRNAALAATVGEGVVVFFDDDALPRRDYLEEVVATFAAHPEAVGLTGQVVLDGVPLRRALSDEEMQAALDGSPAGDGAATPVDRLYGCNMAARLEVARAIGFDDDLPLYAWLEDLDFSRRLGQHGSLIHATRCVAAHQGNEVGGRGTHARFGYSAIANPLHLLNKGSIALDDLPYLVGRPLLANIAGSVRGHDKGWRRERLGGMGLAARDLMSGRLHPARAARL